MQPEAENGMKIRTNRKQRRIGLALASLLTLFSQLTVRAQDLAPRAYLITPFHSNAVTLTWSFYDGSIDFNGTLPSSDAKGTYSLFIGNYYHSFGIFGRSANLLAAVPYAEGNFEGTVNGAGVHLYRSGLTDSIYRVAVNLKGGPAMQPREFIKWKQKVLLGASLKVQAPTGQYDPTKLINWGTNRWAFKPEFGYSERWGKWVLDAYTGVWFFTENNDFWSRNEFYPGTRTQSKKPVTALEFHVSHDFTRRLWASFDANFWAGGVTTVSGLENPRTKEQNSRLGVTAAIPISKSQSLKFSYSNGAYVQFGGDYQNVSVAWQYAWLGRPK
jgi:hypothetical protein